MIPSLAGMEPVDYVRFAAIALGFLATSFSSQKTFLRADVVFSVGMGVGWLCFPNVFLDFQMTGPKTAAHVLYGRCMGLVFLMSVLPIILNKRSRDDKVYASIHLARFLGFSVMLTSLIYCHWKFSKSATKLTARQFWFNGLAIAGWMLGNLRHLLVSGGSRNRPLRQAEDRIKYHLFCDLLGCLPGTLYMLAFGQMTFVDLNIEVNPKDGQMVFSCCVIAALGLIDSIYVLSAHTFDDKEAVKNVFKFRVLAVILFSVMQLTHGLIKTNILGFMMVTYAALLINALLGLRYLTQKTV